MKLIRFWIQFQIPSQDAWPLTLGCGVTAYDYEDAIHLIRNTLLGGRTVPPIINVIENVDIRLLDPNHVQPNIGVVSRRGVWFPHVNS